MKKHSQFNEGINVYNDIEFELNRKNINNLIIRINSKNKIVVSCPLNVSDKFIIEFLDWNLVKFNQHINKINENRSINIDENFFFLFGEKNYFKNDKVSKKIIIKDKKINYANKTINQAIDSYRKKELKVYLIIRQSQLQKLMNIDEHLIRVREKFGSWATNHVNKKTIIYSTNLSSFSKEIIDYVIVHELSHNKYPNHSREFWRLVERYENRYKIKRLKLKKNIYS